MYILSRTEGVVKRFPISTTSFQTASQNTDIPAITTTTTITTMTTAAIERAGEEQKHSSPLNFGNIPQCLYYSKKGSRYLFDITEKYNEVLREKANMYCMRVRCGLSGWCGRGGAEAVGWKRKRQSISGGERSSICHIHNFKKIHVSLLLYYYYIPVGPQVNLNRLIFAHRAVYAFRIHKQMR